MVSSIADTSCIEFKVDVRLAYSTLHVELDTTILMDIVPIPWRERTEVLTIYDIGDIESIRIVA